MSICLVHQCLVVLILIGWSSESSESGRLS